MLEKKSAELIWDPTWVFMTMLDIGIPFPVLHGIYDRLFKAKVILFAEAFTTWLQQI